ncbi:MULTISPECIES: DsbA family protein [unclassified Mesorhizobium]|uniref:DsbA family protein n=1 Tax=unclassified Mesorhizobium TaxID=325217 RepID=UPI0003CF3FA7|nr:MULTISPECIES: DsbA family protein [unclassified Mesorhizobium]ESW92222.1 disulfide bond formation protein DsbD [Mesorhizobium sp. LSJC269B00]ESY06052.1 disulfide bond formation protein DsbD [Mesorhizobium sp. LNJC399B00]ESY25082.1 disulfide bond formation protein DsbD [Mesorhizobium sp. LNJC394B00]ESY26321.1 disulfide bond formation protein DsbD [Mesorhizobium sp. LNJC395A00]ESY29833.1 disulfide bond formation protein DsbD [Mesorhizobium sp. LNJC391B00]
MNRSLSRRNLLSSLAVIPAVAMLAACSDSGEDAKAADVKPAAPAVPASTPATPAAVKVPESSGNVDMAELLKPGALPDKQLGKDDAKVTIVEYASMTCPHCAHFAATTFPELKTKYIDTGKARYILREFPFDPSAEAGFMLARCSKDNYFPMVDVLFKQQANWVGVNNTKDALLQISKLAGFTQESFEACLTDQKLLDDVRSVQKRGADEFKVDSTPTFFINGKTYKGAMSIEEISAIIDPLL